MEILWWNYAYKYLISCWSCTLLHLENRLPLLISCTSWGSGSTCKGAVLATIEMLPSHRKTCLCILSSLCLKNQGSSWNRINWSSHLEKCKGCIKIQFERLSVHRTAVLTGGQRTMSFSEKEPVGIDGMCTKLCRHSGQHYQWCCQETDSFLFVIVRIRMLIH